jgi:predicted GH43/DUF377 family glycosyl hydrolase
VSGKVPVIRSDVRLRPDPGRVVTRAFVPGGHDPGDGRSRGHHIVDRVLAMSPDDVSRTLGDVRARFDGRHVDLDETLARRLDVLTQWIPDPGALAPDTRLLLGAYFSQEYAIEAAALTNPSVVAAPHQGRDGDGSLRVIVSLRAIGEGHISSIEFRTGTVGRDGRVAIEPALPPVHAERRSPVFDRPLFTAKLQELGEDSGHVEAILNRVADRFTMAELEQALALARDESGGSVAIGHSEQAIHWLAASNYELAFAPASALSQRVIFPAGPAESHGMEDARFVRFEEPGTPATYYATYTAYDGFHILPQLIETADFETFRVATLNGPAVQNKGMALFPRLVGGRYAALARLDNENSYLLQSDNVRFWHDSKRIQIPTQPWELVQIGNCGSPIETEAGWLVVTHGVGPMRTYALGAVLLDLDDPSQVVGALRDPLLVPDEDERDGYVPNVVYSCGSLVHDDWLVLAYGASDTTSRFATVSIDALLTELTTPRRSSTSS